MPRSYTYATPVNANNPVNVNIEIIDPLFIAVLAQYASGRKTSAICHGTGVRCLFRLRNPSTENRQIPGRSFIFSVANLRGGRRKQQMSH